MPTKIKKVNQTRIRKLVEAAASKVVPLPTGQVVEGAVLRQGSYLAVVTKKGQIYLLCLHGGGNADNVNVHGVGAFGLTSPGLVLLDVLAAFGKLSKQECDAAWAMVRRFAAEKQNKQDMAYLHTIAEKLGYTLVKKER